MTPVRLEPAALRSRVKHSTTEPLRSLIYFWEGGGGEYQIYFIECSEKISIFHGCVAWVKMLILSPHQMEYIWYSGHWHFGLGRFGLDISATDVSATENAEGGRFGQNHKFWVWDVFLHKCVMHFVILWNQICMWILTVDSKMHDNKSMLFFIETVKLWCILYSSKWYIPV